MTLRQYLILMSLGAMLCWIAWFFVILSGPPAEATFVGFLFFYLSLGLALMGTLSVVVFLIRRLTLKNDELIFRHVRKTFRQSILASLMVIIMLILLAASLLKWWSLLLLVLIWSTLEVIIFSGRKHRNVDYV
jgi:hypothetical protein